jgi:hypothetical protein
LVNKNPLVDDLSSASQDSSFELAMLDIKTCHYKRKRLLKACAKETQSYVEKLAKLDHFK